MKGIVMTTDVVFSIIIVVSILFLSIFAVLRSMENPWSKIRLMQTANDVIDVLSANETLDTMNSGEIARIMNTIIPWNLNLSINISCWDTGGNRKWFSGEKSLEIGGEIEEEYVSGKKIFVDNHMNYCLAEYRIWYA